MLFRSDELIGPESSGCRLSGTERNRRTPGQESSWKEDEDYTQKNHRKSANRRGQTPVLRMKETGKVCYEAGKEWSSEKPAQGCSTVPAA